MADGRFCGIRVAGHHVQIEEIQGAKVLYDALGKLCVLPLNEQARLQDREDVIRAVFGKRGPRAAGIGRKHAERSTDDPAAQHGGDVILSVGQPEGHPIICPDAPGFQQTGRGYGMPDQRVAGKAVSLGPGSADEGEGFRPFKEHVPNPSREDRPSFEPFGRNVHFANLTELVVALLSKVTSHEARNHKSAQSSLQHGVVAARCNPAAVVRVTRKRPRLSRSITLSCQPVLLGGISAPTSRTCTQPPESGVSSLP